MTFFLADNSFSFRWPLFVLTRAKSFLCCAIAFLAGEVISTMPIIAVLGAQWGDEGKGRVVDYLSSRVDIVARFQGGDNAGHTVVVGEEAFKLHLIPSGAISGKVSVLGNGMVINPFNLIKEVEELKKRNIEPRILISDRAHMILPYHQMIDKIQEELKKNMAVGTTKKGIGPAYADKAYRYGLRMGDLKNMEVLRQKLELFLAYKSILLNHFNIDYPSYEEMLHRLQEISAVLEPLIIDTVWFLNQKLAENKIILAEGAQGAHLDIDHGTYPFCTSSNTTSGGVCTGLGVPPSRIKYIIGVVKAYTTRVGGGPFPAELTDDQGDFLRKRGHEYGTTTGRPRRCGWLDLVLVKHAHMINGFTHLAITKLDVLTGLEKIKVVVGYQHPTYGKLDYIPSDMLVYAECEPILKSFKGWKELDEHDILENSEKGINALPTEVQEYLKFIEDFLHIPIFMVSFGPERHQCLILNDIPLKKDVEE